MTNEPDSPIRPRLRLPLAHLALRTGQELGISDWTTVDQDRIDTFAEVTGDRQWIHVDPARAAATPFGGTIAHGYLTLALAPALLTDVLDLSAFRMGINLGVDRLRFVSPVPTGSRIRLRVVLDDLQIDGDTGTLRLKLTFEVENAAKPACVATVLYRVQEDTP